MIWEGGRNGPGRAGYTVIEVLVALGILVISLGGVIGLAMNITRKSRTPDDSNKALFFAEERINYFRANLGQAGSSLVANSVNGFVAAGGTYFPPPNDPRDTVDHNRDPAYHNTTFNMVPTRLVREYLYDITETKELMDALNGSLSEVNRNRTRNAQGFARNEIPVTPANVGTAKVERVVPNDETADTSVGDLKPQVQGANSVYVRAPRANDNLRGAGFSLADKSIRFVREVWVQPMHPLFPAIALPAPLPLGMPNFIPASPYSVVVTVRVYPRDPKVNKYASVVVSKTEGPGYEPRKKALAELVAIVGVP